MKIFLCLLGCFGGFSLGNFSLNFLSFVVVDEVMLMMFLSFFFLDFFGSLVLVFVMGKVFVVSCMWLYMKDIG